MLFLHSLAFFLTAVAATKPRLHSPIRVLDDADSSALQITHACLSIHPLGNTTFNFTVHDPVAVANQKADCSGTWNTKAANYPTGAYLPCSGNNSFEWNVQDFYSPQNFTINVSHEYLNPAIGPPPYDYEQTFALAALSNIAPSTTWVCHSAETCLEPENAVIEAQIWGVSS